MSNIAAHESEFDPNSNYSDFVEAYLGEMARTRDTSSSFHAENGGRQSLVNTVVDLVSYQEGDNSICHLKLKFFGAQSQLVT